MMLNYRTIGQRIREIRNKKNLTQEKLAEMCSLSVSYISRIESGTKHASLNSLVTLGDVLDVTVDTLLYGYQINSKKFNVDLIRITESCNCHQKNLILKIATVVKNNNY